MDRRIVLSVLGTAALASPALGQAVPAKGSAELMDAELNYIAQTTSAGGASLLTSKLALERAKNAEVKMFSEFEVAEQQTIGDVLSAMKDPAKFSPSLQPPSDSEVRSSLDDQTRQMVDMIEKASAASFDKEYLAAQLKGHQTLLKIQNTYLEKGQNKPAVFVAKLARGQIKEHIRLLEKMQSEMG